MSQSYTTLSSGLTTIFTPPPSCSSSWTYEAEVYNSVSGGLLMQNVFSSFVDTSCWPPNFSGNGRENGVSTAPIQIYSPGVCPSGYTTAGGFTQSGTTTAICCLQNYAFLTDFSSQFGRTNLFEGCVSTYPLASGPTAVEGRVDPSTVSSTTVTGPLTMWAQPLWVEFQETDLSLLPATTTTTTTTSSTSQLTASSTAQPSMTKSQPSPSTATSSPTPSTLPHKGLSTGALAGIGVGAALGALLVLAIALFFCLRRRKKSSSSAARIQSDIDGQMGELDAMEPLRKPYSSVNVHGPRSAWQNNELEGSEAARELAGSNVDRTSKGIARKPVVGTRVELE